MPPVPPGGSSSPSPLRRAAWWLSLPAVALLTWGGAGMYAGSVARSSASATSDTVDTFLRNASVGQVLSHSFEPHFSGGADDLYFQVNGVTMHLKSQVRLPAFGLGDTLVDTDLVHVKVEPDASVASRNVARILSAIVANGVGIHTEIRPDGHTESVMALIPGHATGLSGETFSWLTSVLDVTSAGDARSLGINLSMLGLSVSDQGGKVMEMTDVHYLQSQAPLLTHLSTGNMSLTAGKVTFPRVGSEWSGVTLSTALSADGGTLQSDSSLAAGAVRMNSQALLRDAKVELSMRNVDAGAFDDVVRWLASPEHAAVFQATLNSKVPSQSPRVARGLVALRPTLDALLHAGPVISLNATANAAQGKAEGSFQEELLNPASLSVSDLFPQVFTGGEDGTPVGAVIGHLKLSAGVKVDGPLLASLLRSAGGDVSGTAETLGALVSQGEVVQEGNSFRTQVTLQGGALTVNGRPVPLE